MTYSGKHSADNGKPKIEKEERDRRIGLSLFTALSIVIISVIGITVGILMTRHIRAQMLDNYAKYAGNQVSGMISSDFDMDDVNRPLTGEKLEHFQEHLKHALMHDNITNIRIWRPDGLIIFSTTEKNIGKVTDEGQNIAGEFVKNPTKKSMMKERDIKNENFLNLFYPVYLNTENPELLSVVYEVTVSLAPLKKYVNRVMSTVAVGFGGLILVLIVVAQISSIMLRRRNSTLKELTAKLVIRADTDGLTGLNNHRHFQNVLKAKLDLAERAGKKLSLIMIDLDRFKKINDRYGHQTGDKVLKKVSSAFKKVFNEPFYAARYGGEEYVVILPDTDCSAALTKAEEFRAFIENLMIDLSADKEDVINVTLSCGVAEFPEHGNQPNSLIAAADSALLFAKHHGRNQVRSFNEYASSDFEEEDLERLIHRLHNASLKTVQALAAAVDTKDQFHSNTNRGRLINFAKKINLEEDALKTLNLASQLHDVGEATVPGQVLNKSESLSEEEMNIIRSHPEAGVKIVEAAAETQTLLTAILHHHENWDGSGYPRGLKGEEIPYLARILRIIDSFDAMTTERPYRNALSIHEAIEELKQNAGTQFDPKLINKFIEYLEPEVTSEKIKGQIHVGVTKFKDGTAAV